MTPFLMTLDGHNCWNCFRFILLLWGNYFRKYATDLRKLFRIGSLSGVDDCCEIELRSLEGFIRSTPFFVTQYFGGGRKRRLRLLRTFHTYAVLTTLLRCNTGSVLLQRRAATRSAAYVWTALYDDNVDDNVGTCTRHRLDGATCET